MCATCGAHWFGHGDEVRIFTKREWDAWINEKDIQKPTCDECEYFLPNSPSAGVCTYDPDGFELMRAGEGKECGVFAPTRQRALL